MSSMEYPNPSLFSSPTSTTTPSWRRNDVLINLLFIPLFFALSFPFSQSQEVPSSDPAYYYNLCSSSSCGSLSSIPYPFAFPSFCSHPDLDVTCVNNDYLLVASKKVPQMEANRVVSNFSFDAASITVFVAFGSLFGCGPVTRKDAVLGATPFSLSNDYAYGTHLNCTRPPASFPPGSLEPGSCLGCGGGGNAGGGNLCFYTPTLTSVPAECEIFFVFVKEGVNVSAIRDLREYLRRGFEIRYSKPTSCRSCESTGGRCGSSPIGDFICFCPSSAHRLNCSDGMAEDLRTWLPRDRKSKVSKGVIAAISVSASVASLVIIAIAAVIICVIRRKSKGKGDQEVGGNDSKSIMKASFRGLVNGMSSKRYSYSQIKKFTANFSTKLGEGGFGSVYQGFIEGVGAVAIKLLDRSEQSKKQFMNEVATLGRVHHQNLVRLLGYCAQGKTRALVYEFMEKGSLDKYIHVCKDRGQGERGEERISSLTFRQIYNIAVDTARGILYLHEGCRSRILHLDIKPHNVLIDSSFGAKVADFGLARMIDKDHSHVSLTNAQGTPGYAAPEMWIKTYGPVTEKSDVYSYGMLLLEIAGRRMNSELGTENTSQSFFPEWVFKKAERGELKMRTPIHKASSTDHQAAENDIHKDGQEEEEGAEILGKMCLVGLWCIQHIPSKRPTMNAVIQMLEGSDEIELPPHPFPADFNGDEFLSHYFTALNASFVQSSSTTPGQ